MKKQPTYNDAIREQALEIAEEEGAVVASRKTGVPAGTIRSWRSRSGTASPPAGVDLDDWAAAKREGARETWIAAREALDHVRALLAEGKAGEAQKAALTMAILTDKSGVLDTAAAQVEERQVRLAHKQGAVLASVIEAFLRDLGIPSGRAVRKVMRHHLVSAGETGIVSTAPEAERAREEVRAVFELSESPQREPLALLLPAPDEFVAEGASVDELEEVEVEEPGDPEAEVHWNDERWEGL